MSNVQVNDSGVQRLLASLNNDANRDVLLTAIGKAARKVQRQATANLRSRLGIGAVSTGRYGAMAKGIKVRTDRNYCESTVHIMGDFRLRFFERGTQPRRNARGQGRGRISPLYFFRDAASGNLDGIIGDSINESLRRVLG